MVIRFGSQVTNQSCIQNARHLYPAAALKGLDRRPCCRPTDAVDRTDLETQAVQLALRNSHQGFIRPINDLRAFMNGLRAFMAGDP